MQNSHLKVIPALCLLLGLTFNSQAQQLQTYKGEKGDGTEVYTYYLKDGQKIKHGKYKFTEVLLDAGGGLGYSSTSRRVKELIGSYSNDARDGQWIQKTTQFESVANIAIYNTNSNNFELIKADNGQKIDWEWRLTVNFKNGVLNGKASYYYFYTSGTPKKNDTTNTWTVHFRNNLPAGAYSWKRKATYVTGQFDTSGCFDGKWIRKEKGEETVVNHSAEDDQADTTVYNNIERRAVFEPFVSSVWIGFHDESSSDVFFVELPKPRNKEYKYFLKPEIAKRVKEEKAKAQTEKSQDIILLVVRDNEDKRADGQTNPNVHKIQMLPLDCKNPNTTVMKVYWLRAEYYRILSTRDNILNGGVDRKTRDRQLDSIDYFIESPAKIRELVAIEAGITNRRVDEVESMMKEIDPFNSTAMSILCEEVRPCFANNDSLCFAQVKAKVDSVNKAFNEYAELYKKYKTAKENAVNYYVRVKQQRRAINPYVDIMDADEKLFTNMHNHLAQYTIPEYPTSATMQYLPAYNNMLTIYVNLYEELTKNEYKSTSFIKKLSKENIEVVFSMSYDELKQKYDK